MSYLVSTLAPLEVFFSMVLNYFLELFLFIPMYICFISLYESKFFIKKEKEKEK